MVTGKFIEAKVETKVVEIAPAKYILEMNKREALIVQTLLAHTRDIDPEFPEVKSLYSALKNMDLNYFGKYTLEIDLPKSLRMVER